MQDKEAVIRRLRGALKASEAKLQIPAAASTEVEKAGTIRNGVASSSCHLRVRVQALARQCERMKSERDAALVNTHSDIQWECKFRLAVLSFSFAVVTGKASTKYSFGFPKSKHVRVVQLERMLAEISFAEPEYPSL